MTELETLERAKMYMEKLANGINPIDGSLIPDEDIVNNVRLSRCFFYVADVLRKVIDNGGVASQKKSKKEARMFFLSKRAHSTLFCTLLKRLAESFPSSWDFRRILIFPRKQPGRK